MNLIGVIPGFESPTQTPAVPAGSRGVCVSLLHWMGIREQGVGRVSAAFRRARWWLAPLMIPIELISHLSRPLSLTVRLFANMFAGEKVTMTFLSLTFIVAPAIFMGLHVFVAFLQAYHFHAARHDLRRRRGSARALILSRIGFIRSEREPAVPQGGLGTTSSRTTFTRRNTRMKRKLMYARGPAMALASPIFAQTPGCNRRRYRPEVADGVSGHGHCIRSLRSGPGQARGFGLRSMARNPGAQAAHPVRTHFRIGADRIAGVVHAGDHVRRQAGLVFDVVIGAAVNSLPLFPL